MPSFLFPLALLLSTQCFLDPTSAVALSRSDPPASNATSSSTYATPIFSGSNLKQITASVNVNETLAALTTPTPQVYPDCTEAIEGKAIDMAPTIGTAVSGYIFDPAYFTTHKEYKNGAIYCHDVNEGAHVIYGGIYTKFQNIVGFGYPITDELSASDRYNRPGRFNLLSQYDAIYWSQANGAHPVKGGIYGYWQPIGGTNSFLGFPTTDEVSSGTHGGIYQDFTGGMIYWRPGFNGGQGAPYAVDSVPPTQTFFWDPLELGDVRGSTYITIDNAGNLRWSSKLHNYASTVTYDWSIAWVIMNADGTTFELSQHGTLGPSGNADVDRVVNSVEIRANWRAWTALTQWKIQAGLTLSYNQILHSLYNSIKGQNPFASSPITLLS